MTELKKKVNTCSTPINFQTSQMAMTPDEIKIIKRKTKNPSLWHFKAGYGPLYQFWDMEGLWQISFLLKKQKCQITLF